MVNLVQFESLTMTPPGFPVAGDQVTFEVTATGPPGETIMIDFFQRRLNPLPIGSWEPVCQGENASCTTTFPDFGNWVFVAQGSHEGQSGPPSIIGTTVAVERP